MYDKRGCVILTNDSEHARGLWGLCITFVFSLIVKHRLVDDEDVLATLCDNFVFLSLSDFISVLKPADLWDVKEEVIERKIAPEKTWNLTFTVSSSDKRVCSHFDVFSGHFTFKPGRFLLYNLDVVERLWELNVWSYADKEKRIVNTLGFPPPGGEVTLIEEQSQCSLWASCGSFFTVFKGSLTFVGSAWFDKWVCH